MLTCLVRPLRRVPTITLVIVHVLNTTRGCDILPLPPCPLRLNNNNDDDDDDVDDNTSKTALALGLSRAGDQGREERKEGKKAGITL